MAKIRSQRIHTRRRMHRWNLVAIVTLGMARTALSPTFTAQRVWRVRVEMSVGLGRSRPLARSYASRLW